MKIMQDVIFLLIARQKLLQLGWYGFHSSTKYSTFGLPFILVFTVFNSQKKNNLNFQEECKKAARTDYGWERLKVLGRWKYEVVWISKFIV